MNKSKFCAGCGSENKAESKFCAVCGKTLVTRTKQKPLETNENGKEYNNLTEIETPCSSELGSDAPDQQSDSRLANEPTGVASIQNKAYSTDSEKAPIDRSDVGVSANADNVAQPKYNVGDNAFDSRARRELTLNKPQIYFGMAAALVFVIAVLAYMSTRSSSLPDSQPGLLEPSEAPAQVQSVNDDEAVNEIKAESVESLKEAEKAKLEAELERVQLENARIKAEQNALETREKQESSKAAAITNDDQQVQQTRDPSQTAAFKKILEKSRSCFKSKDFDCAVNSAEIGLDLVPGHTELKYLIAESRKRQTEALNNIVIQ